MASHTASGPSGAQDAHKAGKQAVSVGLIGDSHDAERLIGQWQALLMAGQAVAAIAGLPPQALIAFAGDYPVRVMRAGSARRQRAECGIADLARIMTLGLTALATIRQRGGNARAAARALWQEFEAAHKALLALIPPD